MELHLFVIVHNLSLAALVEHDLRQRGHTVRPAWDTPEGNIGVEVGAGYVVLSLRVNPVWQEVDASYVPRTGTNRLCSEVVAFLRGGEHSYLFVQVINNHGLISWNMGNRLVPGAIPEPPLGTVYERIMERG